MTTLRQHLLSAFTVLGGGGSLFCAHAIYTGNERFYREVVMPTAARFLDPETAHRLAVWAAAHGVSPRCTKVAVSDSPTLTTSVFGLKFRHPVGLAAGFDKNGEAVGGLLRDFGFSHVEVGSVTPRPQPGNVKPRVFRLPDDRAIINRYGFNSDGHEAVARRLGDLRAGRRPVEGVVGVNVGKNKETEDAAADYVAGIRRMGELADYLVINVSSPNTPGLRSLQKREELVKLLTKAVAARDALPNGHRPPLLVKIAPDLSQPELEDVCTVVTQPGCRVDGLVVGNTTVARSGLSSDSALTAQTGGLSGAPLRDRSTEVIRAVFRLTRGAVPIVGVGGVGSGADAVEKMKAGASLVQLYTAMAYDGPPVVERICREMEQVLRDDGVPNVRAIVGTESEVGAAKAV